MDKDQSIDGDAESVSDDDESDVSVPEEPAWPYPWTDSYDEGRRCFILDKLASPEIQGALLVENMAAVEAWLKTGEVPAKSGKSKLNVVK